MLPYLVNLRRHPEQAFPNAHLSLNPRSFLFFGFFSNSTDLFSTRSALFRKNTRVSPSLRFRAPAPANPNARNSFRIRTYRCVWKQTTLSPFRIRTYAKTGEGVCPPRSTLPVSSLPQLTTLCPFSAPHQPAANCVSQRTGHDSAQHVRNVVIAAPYGRSAHANRKRQQRPEEPAPVPPCSPQRRNRTCHVLRRKRRAAHAPKMLNEIDRRREWPALQIAMPHSRHRKPRALDRKHHRDAVPNHVARGGVRHRRPVRIPVAPVIQNAADNQQIREIREVRELEKIISQRRRKLFEPQRRMHARQPVIERNQLRVLPAGIYQVHQLRQLFKTEKKKQVRIPVPPEMPEFRRDFFAIQNRELFTPRRNAAQRKNQQRYTRLRCDKAHWMRQIPREDCDHRARKRHITKRDPLKRSTSSPRLCQFVLKSSRNLLNERIARPGIRPRQNRFAHHRVFVLLHRALSGTIFGFLNLPGASLRHSTIFHGGCCATCRKPSSGFTATGFPALASIHWSSALSPYAAHSAKFNFHFSANHQTAIAFASPNIGRPTMRPVQRPSFSSNRVAHTWISAGTFRFANSARSRRAISSAKNSSVPETRTIRSPFAACCATHSTASGKKDASHATRFARRPVERTPRRYALFPCSAY